MSKKKIGIAVAAALVLVLGIIFIIQMFPGEYVPADDEIALHVQLNIEEDIGLLVYDYQADGRTFSGGVSNADKSLMKHGSDIIVVLNRQELSCSSETVELSVQFRVITEYITPNFDNIYPEDITKYLDEISLEAQFGESYCISITGDKTSGYKAELIPFTE